MDPLSSELAKKGISAAVESAKEFLSKLAGPAAEEIGLLLQDQVKFYRFRSQLRILERAEEMLKKSGRTPKAVPYRTLLPILETGATEDDESLSIKWAALLANAAAEPESMASHPSFPRILSEIAPVEAQLLDVLLSMDGEAGWNSFRTDFASDRQVSEGEIDRYYGNLFRLGLIRIGSREGFPKGVVSVSPFGKAFLSACSPPERKAT
jgi:hypothetical protein